MVAMTAARKRVLFQPPEPNASHNLVVVVGFQHEGVTYRLHPVSAARILETFPGVRVAPSVYVGYARRDEFESLHGPMWPQIVTLLTGVGQDRLSPIFSRLILWDPSSGRQWENVPGTLRVVA